jgi:cytochrome c-type biogenesis protein CcmH
MRAIRPQRADDRLRRGAVAGVRAPAPLATALLLFVSLTPMAASGTLAAEAQGGSAGEPFGVVQDLGPPAGAPKTGQALEEATQDLASRLRCPVCQGLSVADSTSVSALAMRDEIQELFAKGYTEEQIVSYFERSFGEFVLLVPKPQGFNLLVWLLPVVALLIGLLIVFRQSGRGTPATPGGTVDDGELADYRARVLREVEGSGGPPE